jgi:L-malate glycosyltransferase
MSASVLMFCPQFRPVVGGAERQVEKLALALAATGCKVTILTPRMEPDSPDMEEANDVRVVRFPLDDLSRRFRVPGVGLLNIPYILWQVARAVRPRLKEALVLHCHIASLETAGAALMGRYAGVPVICKAAMADDRSDLGEIAKGAASGRFVAWLVRSLIQTWVATTSAVQNALVRAGVSPARIVRIPNGVEMPNSSRESAATGQVRRFLYLGRLSSNIERDVPTLLRAFDRLATMHADLELAIVGGGDLLAETRRLAHELPSRERIHLPGFDRPEAWLAWADCFVLPSRREGLSNALLEAMAAGLPCIANDIPPNREVLDDGEAGVLVPLEDCDALEAAMGALIIDPDKARRLSRAAEERALHTYAITDVAARYIDLYRSLRTN